VLHGSIAEELMKDPIDKLLSQSEPLTARDIARKLGLDRSEVSAFLHSHREYYHQDDEYRWCPVRGRELELVLPNDWVDADAFERTLRVAGQILDSPHPAIRISFPSKQCRPMIDCTARLLALVNQLAHLGKEVTVDFTEAISTLRYLNRAGFLDLVRDEVAILPARPAASAAKRYQGQSDTLVEFGAVDPTSDSGWLIEQLTETFVQQSSADYKIAAFTVFSELIRNVAEHSLSSLQGFAGLQKYTGNRPHIKTVVSDSGVGIASTLRPALKKYYPQLFRKYGDASSASDIGIVRAAMSEGGISRFGKGRGLGFKSSREQATKFDASLSVRQQNFCLRFDYKDGDLTEVKKQLNLSKLLGTHICFVFYVA
jgi:hypothetical protein